MRAKNEGRRLCGFERVQLKCVRVQRACGQALGDICQQLQVRVNSPQERQFQLQLHKNRPISLEYLVVKAKQNL